MTSLDGLPVLTAAAMRAAEDEAIAAGSSAEALMARAGRAAAEQVRRLAAGSEVLVLCGPGNNGGDGYVIAAELARGGHPVRVAALDEPRKAPARTKRAGWTGPVETLGDAASAPVVVDALFGSGLSRGLAADVAAPFVALVAAARLAIAVDLPSGVGADDGSLLSAIPSFDLTLALAALKPAHLLQPAAARCGIVLVLDIGVKVRSDVAVLARPSIVEPGPGDHKYSRGMVATIAGAMPGASALSAIAAARGGAGYVLLLGSATDRMPHAIVRRRYASDALSDERINALLVGPGLGRDDRASERLGDALATSRPLIIDGDALHLVTPESIAARAAPTILTPHAGEFAALFGNGGGSKVDRALAAASVSKAIVVFKGADTVIAHPDGRVRIAQDASPWLSTAGTGDVLAGVIAARLAATRDPFAAACEGVWLHGEAARIAGPAFLADRLADALPAAIASCL